jgi:hypothetical protein
MTPLTPLYVNKFPYGNLIYAGGGIKTAKEFFMKKVLVLFIVGVVFFGACSAQNANAQNANIAQRIIGTWVDSYGDKWVFNADGTADDSRIQSDKRDRGYAYKFIILDTKLALWVVNTKYNNNGTGGVEIYNVLISSDGRTIILEGYHPSRNNRGIWLSKQ